MGKQIDNLDLKIINQLKADGRISITELAKKVESSRPTITNRLKSLLDEELVLVKGGLNLRKLGLKMACTGLEVRNDDSRKKLENFLECCPRILNIFRTPDKANIHICLWGEDDHTLNSTIESLRDIQDVEIVYTHYLGTPVYGDIAINIESDKLEETPCGKTCESCHRYDKGWCVGCPIVLNYKNPFVKSG